MTANRYPDCLAFVLRAEGGGVVDDPADHGGATNQGITQRTYDDWQASHGLPLHSVRLISNEEVSAIYRNHYWRRIHGDDLPPRIDLMVFDTAVQHGVSRASKWLQAVVMSPVDGVVGYKTLYAVNDYVMRNQIKVMIDDYMDLRNAFYAWIVARPAAGAIPQGLVAPHVPAIQRFYEREIMTIRQKIGLSLVLFMAWAAFVYLGRSPVEPLIAFLRDALLALGIFTAALVGPKGRRNESFAYRARAPRSSPAAPPAASHSLESIIRSIFNAPARAPLPDRAPSTPASAPAANSPFKPIAEQALPSAVRSSNDTGTTSPSWPDRHVRKLAAPLAALAFDALPDVQSMTYTAQFVFWQGIETILAGFFWSCLLCVVVAICTCAIFCTVEEL
ncbi:glycosyl hydrolase 108 family protein [Propionivibrio sp.]|uniref:glycoside hydrolase family 108 protein n=1 Tax=Propionivibrio sp. TaxID=2212460 RepID=UPI0025DEC938|nr:glycosyl hydrolase 108 family protein [Propionivibrio sp.]MBK7356354.1 hypothetical protein [Propionivibrio sp.]